MNQFIMGLALVLLPTLSGCEQRTSADALGRKLTIVLKSDQVIAPGEADDVLVTIGRTDLAGPVEIEFSNLPSGVIVTNPGPIPSSDAMRTYKLLASPGATGVDDHRVTVTAKLNGTEVREGFALTVTPKK